MTLFLTIVLRVILIDDPTSTRQPALPSHRTLSLRSYPHYFRSNDISLVYSSSIAEAANRLNQTESLYPTFVVYFIDYRRPIFFCKYDVCSFLVIRKLTVLLQKYFNSKNFCCFFYKDNKYF